MFERNAENYGRDRRSFYNKIRKIMRKTIPGTKTENSELVLGIFVLIIKTWNYILLYIIRVYFIYLKKEEICQKY